MTDSEHAPTPLVLPALSKLSETLEMVLGKAPGLTDAGWSPPAGALPVAVGTYRDDEGRLAALVWTDLDVAAGLAAAMAMLPRQRVVEVCEAGDLPADMREAVGEVFNIAVGVVATSPDIHLRLTGVEWLADGLSDEVCDVLEEPRAALFARVDLDDYAAGLLSVALV
ncbi:MAG TPA: hypothetical protein VG650_17210 [Mycobacteriales bacterium]|nr:hypothetical protein [Mycobacteriales bacterium]